jgi:hypothetical protein
MLLPISTPPQTDFIVVGAVEPGESIRFALLPSRWNHRRNLLEPVVLVSNNAKQDKFTCKVLEEDPLLDHERGLLPAHLRLGVPRVVPKRVHYTSHLPELDNQEPKGGTKMSLGQIEGSSSDKATESINPAHQLKTKSDLRGVQEERTSNDSVISALID